MTADEMLGTAWQCRGVKGFYAMRPVTSLKWHRLVQILVIVSCCFACRPGTGDSVYPVVKLNSQQKQSSYEAIEALRQVDVVVKSGVSLAEYKQRYAAAQQKVQAALQQLPPGEVRDQLAGSAEPYSEAMELWESNLKYDEIGADSHWGKILAEKYGIGPERAREVPVREFYRRQSALQVIWATGRSRLDSASKALEKSGVAKVG